MEYYRSEQFGTTIENFQPLKESLSELPIVSFVEHVTPDKFKSIIENVPLDQNVPFTFENKKTFPKIFTRRNSDTNHAKLHLPYFLEKVIFPGCVQKWTTKGFITSMNKPVIPSIDYKIIDGFCEFIWNFPQDIDERPHLNTVLGLIYSAGFIDHFDRIKRQKLIETSFKDARCYGLSFVMQFLDQNSFGFSNDAKVNYLYQQLTPEIKWIYDLYRDKELSLYDKDKLIRYAADIDLMHLSTQDRNIEMKLIDIDVDRFHRKGHPAIPNLPNTYPKINEAQYFKG